MSLYFEYSCTRVHSTLYTIHTPKQRNLRWKEGNSRNSTPHSPPPNFTPVVINITSSICPFTYLSDPETSDHQLSIMTTMYDEPRIFDGGPLKAYPHTERGVEVRCAGCSQAIDFPDYSPVYGIPHREDVPRIPSNFCNLSNNALGSARWPTKL